MLNKDKTAIVEYYKNGQLEWHVPIEWAAPDRYFRHGESVQFFEDGSVKLKRKYEKGVAVGVETIFHRNGLIFSKLPFINGKPDGIYETFLQDGTKESETEYKDGEMVGKPRRFV